MKKIFKAIFVICAIVLINSCGTAKKSMPSSYVADGTGVSSVSQDKAYDKALNNALSKISRKYNSVVNVEEIQQYINSEYTGGNGKETLNFKQKTTMTSSAEMHGIKVDAKYSKHRGEYVCTVFVTIPAGNIE